MLIKNIVQDFILTLFRIGAFGAAQRHPEAFQKDILCLYIL